MTISKHCIFRQNFKLEKNQNTEIIQIDEETIKNAKDLKLNQSCDDRNLTINKNVLIHRSNCKIKSLDHYFSNTKDKFAERFFYPVN